MPIIYIGGAALLGWLGYKTIDAGGTAMGAGAQLAKWGAIAGGVYIGYRVLKGQGALK